jgi:SAM-dependent methyltransferase
MDEHQDSIYERFSDRYVTGEVPWNEEMPPPEVVEFAPTLTPGRALDLGCGYGRASIYLAGLGWEVDGIDFIPAAIAEAAKRARDAGVKLRLHIASITELDFLAGPYDFALDVGCAHILNRQDLERYRDQLAKLLPSGAYLLIYGRLRESDGQENEGGPVGLDETEFLSMFATAFELEWMERGITQVEDQPPWSSAWFRFRRR